MKKMLSILALFCIAIFASAEDLTVGTTDNGTITFKVGSYENVTTAKEGDEVTVIITPHTGYDVKEVKGTWYASQDITRGDIDILKDFTITPDENGEYKFIMKRANAEISATYTKNMGTSSDINVADIAAMTYTGEALKPELTVKDGNTILTRGTDYTLTYENNINAGTAKVIVTGMGNYSGTKTVEFTINPAELTEVALEQATFTYNKKEQTAKVKQVTAGTLTVPAEGYEVSGDKATNAGNYTLTVTGKGNFKGQVTGQYSIVAADANLFTLSLDQTEYTYDETEKRPTAIVKDGDQTLATNVDYTLTYENNINAGTGKVIVIGKGNYAGTKTAEFTIHPAELTEVVLEKATFIYNKTEQTAKVKHVTAGTLTVPADGYEVNGDKATSIGNYTLTVTGKGNFTGQVTGQYSIVAADANLFTLTLEQTEFTYDGTEKKPTAIVKDGEHTLTIDVDYTLTFENNINAGTGKVIVIGKGNYEGTKTAEFTINPAELTEVVLEKATFIYNKTEQTAKVKHVTAGTLTVPADGYEVSGDKATSIGNYTLTVTGKGNFKGQVTGQYSIVAADANLFTLTLEQTEFTYDGTEKKPTAIVKDGEHILVLDTDYTLTYENNINAGTGKVIVIGKGNYSGTKTAEFTIKKADITTYIAPKGKTLYFTGTAQDLIEAGSAEGGEMLYSLVKEGEYKATIPQATEVGEYTIYYMIKGDANHNDTEIKSVTASISGLPLKVAAGEYATFYYTENLTTYDEDAELYTIASVSNGKAVLEKIEGIVPSETPILVKNTSSADKTIILVPTTMTPDIAIQKAEEFKGTAEDKQMAASSSEKSLYMCNGKEFVKVVGSGTLGANRCWLEIDNTSAQAASSMISICEETTDIRSLTHALSDGKGKWYDMSGRQLPGKPSKKGVYICNGNKVVIK